MVKSAHFFQRHAGMDLVDVDCELVLDALYLEYRGQKLVLLIGID